MRTLDLELCQSVLDDAQTHIPNYGLPASVAVFLDRWAPRLVKEAQRNRDEVRKLTAKIQKSDVMAIRREYRQEMLEALEGESAKWPADSQVRQALGRIVEQLKLGKGTD